MNNIGKSRIAEFTQKLLIPKEISFHAPIKKSNYKSFGHVMQNIWTTKKDGSVKVAERKAFSENFHFHGLKTGKPVDFKAFEILMEVVDT